MLERHTHDEGPPQKRKTAPQLATGEAAIVTRCKAIPTAQVEILQQPEMADIARRVRIDPKTGCWLWKLSLDRDGYGRYRSKPAHRHVYQRIVGDIPDGLVLDHFRCDTPQCVNPFHVQPCTNWQNTQRGNSPAARNARKSACDHGHEFSPSNTYRWHSHRHCRSCNREAVIRFRLRRKGGA